jgi:hypothetical protein
MGTLDVNGRMQIKINIRVKREIRKLILEKVIEITSKPRWMIIIVCRLYDLSENES